MVEQLNKCGTFLFLLERIRKKCYIYILVEMDKRVYVEKTILIWADIIFFIRIKSTSKILVGCPEGGK